MDTPKIFDDNQKISLLLSRLSWPSGLVRERACVEIANLLTNKSHGKVIKNSVLNWIADQPLESLQAVGLLVFAHAQNRKSDTEFPSEQDLLSNLQLPSLLSWIIFKEIFQKTSVSPKAFMAYERETEPVEEPAFFRKYITGYLPPIYDFWASKIEERGIPFHSHWAFEWKGILSRLGKEPTAREGDFWFRHLPNGERYIIIDTEMSEIYRSSYLRTLAWLVCENGFPFETALFFVAETCPIDLELWRLKPQECPRWWPKPKNKESIVDSSIADLWMEIGELWDDTFLGKKTGLRHQVIAKADGSIKNGDMLYEIRINGIFQKCVGPRSPELNKLSDWCDGNDGKGSNALEVTTRSTIAFSGQAIHKQYEEVMGSFDDWLVVATSCNHRLHIRWQPWRNEIFLPSHVLIRNNMSFGVRKQELIAEEDRKPIGRFFDWTCSIRETNYGNLPYESGSVLLLPRNLILDFCKSNKFSFCWFVTINAYYKEKSFDKEYEKYSDYRCFGASQIMLP